MKRAPSPHRTARCRVAAEPRGVSAETLDQRTAFEPNKVKSQAAAITVLMVVQLDAIQLFRRHVIVATESERASERTGERAGEREDT